MTDPLISLAASNRLEPYIRYIRFPYFKNLMPHTKIDFDYPLTALVGANGSQKSTVLRAIYGCPKNYNLGELWFSTDIDPIVETEGQGRNRFIYGYRHASSGRNVEVIKSRIHNESDPDYWEPSRPLTSDGMEKMPPRDNRTKGRSKTRWDAIEKEVVFLDFRQELSAFDKAFFQEGFTAKGTKSKKQRIRARSAPLSKAIESTASSMRFYGTERVYTNRILENHEIEAINKILQKQYTKVIFTEHSFFNFRGHTCVMITDGLRYSEAFAGSGEFAIIILVVKILQAKRNSLILLDEPEVSLHPGAQERLIAFLKSQIVLKHHQIIFTTHSPSMIRNLPASAIKVFMEDKQTRKIALPSQNSTVEAAFFHIGEPVSGRKTVIVEDMLAAEFVARAKRLLDQALVAALEIRFYPGGAETLWGYFVPAYAAEDRSDVLGCEPIKVIPESGLG